MNLTAKDIRTFVPAKDFSVSKAFYVALGWTVEWEDDELAVLELGDRRFYLQNYFQKNWAENTMLHITVENVLDWYDHILTVTGRDHFPDVRVHEPVDEAYGARVVHVIDPSGVLLHFAEWL